MMNWEAVTDKDKTGLVLEHVMGYFVLGAIATGWRTPDLRAYRTDRFHWPIAFWNSDGECWMTRDSGTDPVPFDPLHDMNDAWPVLQKIAARYDEQAEYLDEVFYKFRKLLLDDSGDEIWTATELLLDMAKWTPERICKAALEAVGVDIKEQETDEH